MEKHYVHGNRGIMMEKSRNVIALINAEQTCHAIYYPLVEIDSNYSLNIKYNVQMEHIRDSIDECMHSLEENATIKCIS